MKYTKLLTAAALSAGLALGTSLPAQAADTNPNGVDNHFDLQAHRGGLGLTVESTLASFCQGIGGRREHPRARPADHQGRTGSRHPRPQNQRPECQDTAPSPPATRFPYVGKYIKDLTFAQVRSLDCGSLTLANYPGQQASPGAKMPTLAEVFDLTRQYRASQVKFNIETKVEAGAPEQTAPREQFVDVALREIDAAGMMHRVSIQSFDWGALRLVKEREPGIRTVALTNKDFLQAGQPGASPWLGGIDSDDFGGDLVEAQPPSASTRSPRPRHPAEREGHRRRLRPLRDHRHGERAHAKGMQVIPGPSMTIP